MPGIGYVVQCIVHMVPIITCEHAGNRVPGAYRSLFVGQESVLESHRGWDPGALEIAQHVSKELGVLPVVNEITRLLVEINRSLHHPNVFSEFSSALPLEARQLLLDTIYHPYRQQVEHAITQTGVPVLHISMHSFTPTWNGVQRKTDLGILFDPARSEEEAVAEHLKGKLEEYLPTFSIDYNEPYKGVDDGFTTYLRTRFSNREYRGIEIEVNQRWIGASDWANIKQGLSLAIASAIQ